LLEQSGQWVTGLEAQLSALKRIELDLQGYLRTYDALKDRLDQSDDRQSTWEKEGAPRLAELESLLVAENFALGARHELAAVDAELREIGYDAATHDQVRRLEAENRHAEADLRELEKARATQAALAREMEDLQRQCIQAQQELAHQVEEHTNAAAALAAAEAQAPDLFAAERELYAIQEQENRLRLEVGAARQKVLVLDDLKTRRKKMEAEQEEILRQVGRFKQLERAFGKDGVPALLIEQALPQIEEKANEILDRLSSGTMAVRFVTQAAYKDKKREDLKETLDIQISDTNGTRDYEMYSGGEAFRVNFAIRLALSEVLAQRAGARLQMLVIDEGFGS
jgi:exonuclease SbcC